MRTSIVTPGGDPPSIGDGIVRPHRFLVNDGQLPGQVPGTEEQAPAFAAGRELPRSVQAAQVIWRVPGSGCCLSKAEQRLILAVKKGLNIGEHFVTELRSIDLSTKSCELVAPGTPTSGKILARHGRPVRESG